MLRSALLAAFLLATAPAFGADVAPAAGAGWAAEFDKLWLTRDDPKIMKQLYGLIEQQLKKDETDFEANWRFAGLLNWDANNYPDGELKAGLGKRAWTVADRAISKQPDDVRGQYNAAVGIGLYSEGVGILNALSQGLEGKFKSRIQAALRIDKDYLQGAPQVVWGRYFYKLPWPKRDIEESIKVLRAAVAAHPGNLRARWYLADSLFADDKKAEAKKQVEELLAAPIGDKDPVEDKKVKAEGQKFLQSHQGDF